MNIAFITTELYPYAKVGGLGDVSYALPLALADLKENVEIFMPFYKTIDKRKFKIRKYNHWKTFKIKIGDISYEVELFRGKLEKKVTVYFIYNEKLFDRNGIYTDENGKAFKDNHIRDIFFSKAVLEVIKKLDKNYEILHINDSHTALIAPYIKLIYNKEDIFKNTKVLLTIHNLGAAYQGIHEAIEIERAGFSYDLHYLGGPLEYYGKFNFLKAGIYYADKIVTVSPKYAQEIKTPQFGEGLDGLLNEFSDKLTGILNGMDDNTWNPSKDTLIVKNYSVKNFKSGKAVNKKAVLEVFGLKNHNKPLIVMISRLTTQKGFDLLESVAYEISNLDVNFAVLGTGEKNYEMILSSLSKRFSSTFSVKTEYNNRLAHLMEAGGDFFLMPSKYEPCGLNQMYSLAYGTLPIVKAVGGLDDTIISYPDEKANGFKFYEHKAEDMLSTIKLALNVFNEKKDEFEAMIKRGMKADLSWRKSAKLYIKEYKSLYK
jgi:starch synthase